MDVNPKQRRRHSAEFEAQVLAACAEPGASVAAVALSYKLNDNLVHQWLRGRRASPVPSARSTTVAESVPQFIALSLPLPSPTPAPAPAVAAVEEIRLEFKRGTLGVSVTWPVFANCRQGGTASRLRSSRIQAAHSLAALAGQVGGFVQGAARERQIDLVDPRRTRLALTPWAIAMAVVDMPGCMQPATASALNSLLCSRRRRRGPAAV